MILGICDRLNLGFLGWVLFVLTTSIYLVVWRFTYRQYELEIRRQRELIDKLLPERPEANFTLENP
jgi:hypothetical protein